MQNDNEFKKNPGVAGRVTKGSTADGDAVSGAMSELFDPDGYAAGTCDGKTDKRGNPVDSACVGFDFTDGDGWWQLIYKHKGKSAFYDVTMTLPDVGEDWSDYCAAGDVWSCYDDAGTFKCLQQVELKGNAFSEVNLELFETGDAPTTCSPLDGPAP